ncbi:hypothetical protein J6590_008477 [Homalodisca vitripennis]|nr:hypothetical protein J6590_008477 [Homalodisca vitripennis]
MTRHYYVNELRVGPRYVPTPLKNRLYEIPANGIIREQAEGFPRRDAGEAYGDRLGHLSCTTTPRPRTAEIRSGSRHSSITLELELERARAGPRVLDSIITHTASLGAAIPHVPT